VPVILADVKYACSKVCWIIDHQRQFLEGESSQLQSEVDRQRVLLNAVANTASLW
jgi:hypothetical protein